MGLGSRMTNGLRNLFQKRQVESKLDDEVRSYVDIFEDDNGQPRLREVKEMPPPATLIPSPYDPEARFSATSSLISPPVSMLLSPGAI